MLKERIETNLQKAFSPTLLKVVDQSHLHEGHAGHRPGAQTHFSVKLISEHFNGLSRIQRHRLVFEALTAEVSDGVHALQLQLVSQEESNELE